MKKKKLRSLEMDSPRACELVMTRDTGMVRFAKGTTAGQNSVVFDASPVIYEVPVRAMTTANVLSFGAIATVGPPRAATPTDPRLLVYANFTSECSPDEMAELVQDLVRSKCKTLIASAGPITMKDIKSPHFKDTIIKMIEPRLSQCGLMVYNLGFDVALDHAYFSNLVSNTDPVLFAKQLKRSDLDHQLALPKKVFDHLLETFNATFTPGVGLTYAQGHLNSHKFNFNVADDWGIIRELTCRIRKNGEHCKPEVVSSQWKQFVYDWNLKLNDFIIFYELFGHFTGVKYRIGVVRNTRPEGFGVGVGSEGWLCQRLTSIAATPPRFP